jgi:toxin YoeB
LTSTSYGASLRLEFDPDALIDLRYWIEQDRRKALKLMELFAACLRDPFAGIGKPEPLQHDFAGCWSRRIDREHRMIYRVEGERLIVLQCRYHYG